MTVQNHSRDDSATLDDIEVQLREDAVVKAEVARAATLRRLTTTTKRIYDDWNAMLCGAARWHGFLLSRPVLQFGR